MEKKVQSSKDLVFVKKVKNHNITDAEFYILTDEKIAELAKEYTTLVIQRIETLKKKNDGIGLLTPEKNRIEYPNTEKDHRNGRPFIEKFFKLLIEKSMIRMPDPKIWPYFRLIEFLSHPETGRIIVSRQEGKGKIFKTVYSLNNSFIQECYDKLNSAKAAYNNTVYYGHFFDEKSKSGQIAYTFADLIKNINETTSTIHLEFDDFIKTILNSSETAQKLQNDLNIKDKIYTLPTEKAQLVLEKLFDKINLGVKKTIVLHIPFARNKFMLEEEFLHEDELNYFYKLYQENSIKTFYQEFKAREKSLLTYFYLVMFISARKMDVQLNLRVQTN